MQLMALHAGGRLNQYLPETLASHAMHKNSEHRIAPVGTSGLLRAGVVWSNHRQAVDDPGTLRIIARSEDGVVEGIVDASRHWWLGVQWHPERTSEAAVGQELFNALTAACDR
jgi:putative glutamine amidotransferase